MKKYLTLDVGGSAIKYGLIQEDLIFIEKSKIPTPLDSMESFVNAVGSIYDQYKDEIEGMAISMPGIIDPSTGHCYTGGALSYVVDVNMADILRQRCPLPISIGNDAKCAANAEVGFGALKDIDDGAVVILGTGIGGCLIKDHKVHIGKHLMAGEFSSIKTDYHNPIAHDDEWCKRNGIAGLLKRVQEALNTDEHFTGVEIFEMANNGNEKVIAGIDQFALEVATQIFNIHFIFDCEKVAIGGGISAQPLLIELIQKHFDNIISNIGFNAPRCEVVVCEFRNDANMIGALYQLLEMKK